MKIYPIAFVIVLAVCFGAQSLALRLAGGKTVKSESNYFSSLARIQNSVREAPEVVLLGSSMTGRIADRVEAVPGVANLGCDGGSAVVTLRAMDRGLLPTAPLVIVEANSLAFELEGRGREISAAMDGAWFRLGARVPVFGATARPTAFGYSWLMGRRAGSAPVAMAEGLPVSSAPRVMDSQLVLPPEAAALVDELCGIFARLEARGSRVWLVVLPPGAVGIEAGLPQVLAAESGVAWWDLNDGLEDGAVGFTDGLHLDGPGAAMVLRSLLNEAGGR